MKRMDKLAYHFGLKVRFYPSDKQKQIIKCNYDTQRFVYNEFVGKNLENYHLKQYLRSQSKSALPLTITGYSKTVFNLIALNQTRLQSPKLLRQAYFFLQDKQVDSLAIANAIKNYHRAWQNYHKIGHGRPHFHKKGYDWSYQTNCQYNSKAKDAYLTNGIVRFTDCKHVKLPKLGLVRISGLRNLIKKRIQKQIPTRIGTVTISKTADDQFYVAFQLASDYPFVKKFIKTGTKIGIDLNLDNFLTESTGKVIDNPRYYRLLKNKLAYAQRVLSRRERHAKQKKRNLRTSKNYQKQRLYVAKIKAKIRRQRNNFLHFLSTVLIKNHDLVVAEELRSKNMLKNHALSLSISDVGWRSFLTMLSYKADLYGKKFATIDPKYTTQRCSHCGSIMGHNGYNKLTLADRFWTCPICQYQHVRDWNAAINIIEKYYSYWHNPKLKKA